MDPHLLPDVLIFLNVVRSGSITKAANHLHTVQSNVTARIKKLEDALGLPLLSRHARGVRLTSGGEAVLPMALRLDALLNDLGYAFGRRIPVKEAKLRLGAIETVAAVQLPRLVSEFLRDSPHVDISVQAGSSSRLIQQVKDGELDAAFVSRTFGLPDFREELVFEDKLVVLAPKAIKTLSALLNAIRNGLKVMVQRFGCSYTEKLLHLLRANRIHPDRIMEIGTLEGIIGFVETGVGVAAMPESFVQNLLRGRKLVLLPLPKDIATIQTFVVSSQISESSLLVSAFGRSLPIGSIVLPILVADAPWHALGSSCQAKGLVQRVIDIGEGRLGSIAERQDEQELPIRQAGIEEIAMILYTSGTTGRSKGAMVSWRQIHWNAVNTTIGLRLTQGDSSFLNTPLYHTGGWHVLFAPLMHLGGRVVLQKQFDAASCNDLITRERITILFGIPTTLRMMMEAPNFAGADFSSLRFAICGGEPCPVPVIRVYQEKGVPVRQGYGLTEAGPSCFSLPAEDAIRKEGSVGFPNFHVETRIEKEGKIDKNALRTAAVALSRQCKE